MRTLDYSVQVDEFGEATPLAARTEFANVVASSNADACSQLVFACHFDSKLMRGSLDFVGATDSAVSCAMLLELAALLRHAFRQRATGPQSLGLRLVFFDGEEAFGKWTEADSLYGSRHLAAKWAAQRALGDCATSPAGNNKRNRVESELDKIGLFVLLDLLGASDSNLVALHAATKPHYDAMRRLEVALLAREPSEQRHSDSGTSLASVFDFWPFNAQHRRSKAAFGDGARFHLNLQDDHTPFEARAVPVLLLLSTPFPSVWHTRRDDWSAIDWPKSKRILRVLHAFAQDYERNFYALTSAH